MQHSEQSISKTEEESKMESVDSDIMQDSSQPQIDSNDENEPEIKTAE